jgi:ribonuclease HI
MVKINWDATASIHNKRVSLGVVVWDENGELVAALAKGLPYIADPKVVETLAAWQAVNLCHKLGIQRVMFERDSLTVVSALNKEGPCWSVFSQLIVDTKTMLSSLSSYAVRHVGGEAKKVTHCMTMLAF